MKEAKSICTNLNSILNKAESKHKCQAEEVSDNVFSIDIPVKDLKMTTVDKLISVSKKYKTFKSHELLKTKLRLIFDVSKTKNESVMIKDFATFVTENYYFPGNGHETKTQKIVYPVNEYEIGERVQVSVYADSKRAGATGFITVPSKVEEGKVCVEFEDGKTDNFSTTEINRV